MKARFRLENLWAARPQGVVRDAVVVARGRLASGGSGLPAFDLDGALVLPAFLNAHDHLELNGLPRIGTPASYRNVRDWFSDVWDSEALPEFKAWLEEPLSRRLGFSAFLNLVNGCLTVFHHNPYYFRHFFWRFPVDVPRIAWCHSLALEKNPRGALARSRTSEPFVIHFAEGIDAEARDEIGRLKTLGLLTSRTVLVHAVGLGDERLAEIRAAGAGVVWCPSSNLFLFGETLRAAEAFRLGLPVALGTDSTLSGEGGLLRELALARKLSGLSGLALLKLATEAPARLFRVDDRGSLDEGKRADLLVVDRPEAPEAFCPSELTHESIQLVLRAGRPILGAPRFERLFETLSVPFSEVRLGSVERLLDARLLRRFQHVFESDYARESLARLVVRGVRSDALDFCETGF